MITKSKFKKIDSKGVRPFSVVKDLTLEILTESSSVDGTTKTFIKDGTFSGELVAVKLQRKLDNGNWVQYGEGKGFMVRNESNNGFWLVPFNVTKPAIANIPNNLGLTSDINNAVNDTKDTLIDDITNDIQYINDNPQKKILGFTYKQIAIIAVLLIIARKL
jgi:hypothetical protein